MGQSRRRANLRQDGGGTRADRGYRQRVQLEPHSPIIIEVTRPDEVESFHVVDAVISSREGPTGVWGDPGRRVFARSAIKSIQAIPLITSGAADAFDVTDDELALMCSSHSAETAHVEMIESWLTRVGLTAAALECGDDRPKDQAAAEAAVRAGRASAPIFNVCSGKHTGFLALAVHLGEDPRHYIRRDHPAMQRVEDTVSTMTSFDLRPLESGNDGCGIPVFAIPLENLALGMARLVDPVELDDPTATACRRLVGALPSRSHLVSGTGRCEVELAESASEPFIAKSGAEGVFMAALPRRGLGIALKVRDGASRAAEEAIRAVLHHMGALAGPLTDTPIDNKAGLRVGVRRAVLPR